MTGEGDDVVDTAGAAALLEVSQATVRRLAREGSLVPKPVSPHLRRPKRLEFPRSEVERFMREGRQPQQKGGE